jgi:hypothetical protein
MNDNEERTTTATTEVNETTIREQILTLVSCAPDVWTSKQRAIFLQKINELIEQEPLARHILSEWKGKGVDVTSLLIPFLVESHILFLVLYRTRRFAVFFDTRLQARGPFVHAIDCFIALGSIIRGITR